MTLVVLKTYPYITVISSPIMCFDHNRTFCFFTSYGWQKFLLHKSVSNNCLRSSDTINHDYHLLDLVSLIGLLWILCRKISLCFNPKIFCITVTLVFDSICIYLINLYSAYPNAVLFWGLCQIRAAVEQDYIGASSYIDKGRY